MRTPRRPRSRISRSIPLRFVLVTSSVGSPWRRPIRNESRLRWRGWRRGGLEQSQALRDLLTLFAPKTTTLSYRPV